MDATRVVIADDHEVVRDGIAHALKQLPNLEIVGEAGDGPALLSILARVQPDCLILDIAMPDFEPISAIREIRASYPNLRILVVSAYDDDVYVQGMLSAGVQGYHLKDQPLSDLKLAVQRVLAGERWVCSPLVGKLLHSNQGMGSAVQLTARQHELLRYLQQGLDNQSIAQRTGLSVKTIENHLTHLYRQLHVASRLEAVNYVAEHPEVLAGSPHGTVRSIAGVTSPARTRGIGDTSPARTRLDILIVDDNMRYRTQLRRMIGRAAPGARICEADNTLTATGLAQQVRPELALVDVVLGEENGIECLKRIRELSASTRVILMSAYPDRAFHQLGSEAGAVAFLDKRDMNTAALREIIDDAVR